MTTADAGTPTPTARRPLPPEPGGRQKKRGRETAIDMIRSLGLVMLIVVPVWFFAQPPDSDEAEIRVIDPVPELQAWTTTVEQAPVPGALPDDWRPTAAQYLRAPEGVRVGYNTPSREYAEYAASTGPAAEVIEEFVGDQPPTGTVDVAGQQWQRYDDEDGSISLVRPFGTVTVVVGTLRASAQLDELVTLAEGVRPAA